MDALYPFIKTLVETGDVKKAAVEAHNGAESTRGMKAKLGRSVYVSDVGDVPDPGAVGVAVFVKGLADSEEA
jgi:dihydroxyacetone kinase